MSSFTGALVPLVLATAFPIASWLAIVLAICLLGALGIALARATGQSPLPWAVGLMIGGAVISAIGVELRLV